MPASCAGCGVARVSHVARTSTERDTGSQEERDKSIATRAKNAAENSALKKLRSVMLSDLQEILLDGEVEIDDSYIGGKRKGRRGRGAAGKTPIIGMISRSGKAFAKPVSKLTFDVISECVIGRVDDDATIITDEFKGYGILNLLDWKHQVVNHSETYSDNGVHTIAVRLK